MSLAADLVAAYRTTLGNSYYRYIMEEAYDGGRRQIDEKNPQSVFEALLRVQKTSFSRLGIEPEYWLPDDLFPGSIPIFIERELSIRYKNLRRCMYSLGVPYDEEITRYSALKESFLRKDYEDFLTFDSWTVPKVTEIDPAIASVLNIIELDICRSRLYRVPDEICLSERLKTIWGTEEQKRAENPLSRARFIVLGSEWVSS